MNEWDIDESTICAEKKVPSMFTQKFQILAEHSIWNMFLFNQPSFFLQKYSSRLQSFAIRIRSFGKKHDADYCNKIIDVSLQFFSTNAIFENACFHLPIAITSRWKKNTTLASFIRRWFENDELHFLKRSFLLFIFEKFLNTYIEEWTLETSGSCKHRWWGNCVRGDMRRVAIVDERTIMSFVTDSLWWFFKSIFGSIQQSKQKKWLYKIHCDSIYEYFYTRRCSVPCISQQLNKCKNCTFA